MCGIIGYVSKGEWVPEPALFQKAVDSLSHRGPNERGIWNNDQAGLGFRRLSIIDLQTGSQPMSNEDGTLHLIFNGEIYNFPELRDHLESRGHHFKTRSDSETILHLYEDLGERCVENLRGMFAFAIYDEPRHTLFLARDRFGKKPLVYSETATGFYFASEIGSLLKLADCTRDVHPDALDAYLTLQYVPSPYTAWKEIRRLPAASTMFVRDGKASLPARYWELDWTKQLPAGVSDEDAVREMRELLEQSVRSRSMADVPLGAFLSGGVDSSITAAAMKKVNGKVRTFCIGFDDPRFDESDHARKVARILNTDHFEMRVQPDSLDSLDELVDHMGEPFADQSLLPTHLLSRFTYKHVTVALSGDGGDELFGGYKRYQHLKRARQLQRLGLSQPWLLGSRLVFAMERLVNSSRRSLKWPRSALDTIVGRGDIEQYLALLGSWHDEDRLSIWKHSPEGHFAAAWIDNHLSMHQKLRGIAKWQAVDVETYLADDILRKVDHASMACSLEVRCPLLDQDIAAFAASLPARLREKGRRRTKVILKRLYPEAFPPKFFDREKKGFSMPIGKWMRRQWKDTVEESIEGKWSAGLEATFRRTELQRVWTEHLSEHYDHGQRLWTWFMLWKWDQRFHPQWNQ